MDVLRSRIDIITELANSFEPDMESKELAEALA